MVVHLSVWGGANAFLKGPCLVIVLTAYESIGFVNLVMCWENINSRVFSTILDDLQLLVFFHLMKNISGAHSFAAAYIADNAIGGAGSGLSFSKAAQMLASSSARSFPAITVWLGTHRSETRLCNARWFKARTQSDLVKVLTLGLLRAFITVWLSGMMATLQSSLGKGL